MLDTIAVPFIAHQNLPTDLLTASFWEDKILIHQLYDPWRQVHPKKTSFAAIHDDQAVYFYFEVTVDGYHAQQIADHRQEVAQSDRVELFFKRDDRMQPYYCLEVDYLGRCFDYRADFHRQMDYDFHWPKGWNASVRYFPQRYQVLLKIEKTLLSQWNLLQEKKLQVGVFQATYFQAPDQNEMHTYWYSWVDPGTPQPDFHVPSAFGVLQLV